MIRRSPDRISTARVTRPAIILNSADPVGHLHNPDDRARTREVWVFMRRRRRFRRYPGGEAGGVASAVMRWASSRLRSVTASW